MKQPIIKSGFGWAARFGAMLVASQLFICTVWADDSAAIADLKAKLAAVENDIAQMNSSHGMSTSETGLALHGFIDVNYTLASKVDTRSDQAGRGFNVNGLDFYLTPQFGDRVKALVELLFEFDAEGGLATDLERGQIGYTFSDQLTTWMGRFHTPYGNWNTGFHHGANIQTAVFRPRFLDFEDKGGVMPSHTVGAWATGTMHLSNGKLSYDAYVGNGNEIQTGGGLTGGTSMMQNTRDRNGNSIVGGTLGYTYANGLQLGVHTFSERVNVYDTAVSATVGEVAVQMTGLYGFYDQNDWEVFAEYYHFNDENLTGVGVPVGSNSSWAGFVQVGRTFKDDWTPYVRLEKATLDQKDLYFSSQEYGVSYSRQALGVRYTLNPKAAVKLEINHTKEGRTPLSGLGSEYSLAKFQYAILF